MNARWFRIFVGVWQQTAPIITGRCSLKFAARSLPRMLPLRCRALCRVGRFLLSRRASRRFGLPAGACAALSRPRLSTGFSIISLLPSRFFFTLAFTARRALSGSTSRRPAGRATSPSDSRRPIRGKSARLEDCISSPRRRRKHAILPPRMMRCQPVLRGDDSRLFRARCRLRQATMRSSSSLSKKSRIDVDHLPLLRSPFPRDGRRIRP